MNHTQSVFKIAVLDDSRFYKTLFTHQLSKYAQALSRESGAEIQLQGFEEAEDFMDHLDPDTNMAFIDYYLDHGITASDVLPQLRIMAPQCTVVIISRSLEAESALRSPAAAAARFILKDEDTMLNSSNALREVLTAGSLMEEAEI